MAEWTADEKRHAPLFTIFDETYREQQRATNEAMRKALEQLSRKCICCGGPGHDVEH